MPSDESRDSTDERPARAVSERPADGGRKKKIKRPKAPIPRTEREIDAPDRVTLLMLGVMGVMTIVLWAFAKGGCNYHPPRETRRPRAVKTEELARDPKDAALEMQQRFVQYDFDGALELSADAAETEVKQRKTECASKVKECAENKKKNERTATTAALLERDMGSAVVRATSLTPPSGKLANILKLERRGPTWKVVSFAKDDGSYQPKVPEPPQLVPGSMMQAVPAASGAASAAPAAKKAGTPSIDAPKPATSAARAPAPVAPAAPAASK